MRRPGGGGHQVAVAEGFVHGDVHVLAARAPDVGADRRVGRTFSPFQNSGRSQQLCAVADTGDRLAGSCKMLDDLDDLRVQANVFRGPAARDHQGVVAFRLHLVEGGIEGKVVPAFFAVRLVPLEVMDGRAHRFTGLLAGTDGMHRVPDGQQGLKRNHHLVVFDKVSYQHENLFCCHSSSFR